MMNREEAIKFFEALLHYLAEDECNEDARAAANLAIEALRGPQPDPITGLVPCGCGGRAKQEDFFDGFFYFGAIKCSGCEIEIRIPSLTPEESSDRVKVAWNRAMGYKGGAE